MKPRFAVLLSALSLVLLLGIQPLWGDDTLPEDRGAAGLWQKLLKLRTTASALHITAHPDDEDGPMLTMLSRGQGAEVTLLTLNRGEGGADLIAPFFYDYLGVLRTEELLEADRYYGVKQYFSHVTDYGFSKTMDEALRKWGGQENVLRDVVRVVRRERPDVVLARFRGNPLDGHGNHQTAGLMAKLVFDAAGDPNRFPEQIAEGLKPWRPKKLYEDNIRPDFRADDKDYWTLEVHSGEYDPMLGRSYAQISRQGLNFQRSQGGGGRPQPSGDSKTYYKLLKTTIRDYAPQREQSFFDDIDTSVNGIAKNAGPNPPQPLNEGLRAISNAVDAAFNAFNPVQPEKVVEPLVAGLKATRELLSQTASMNLDPDARDQINFLLNRKEQQFQSALVAALGIDLDAAVQPDNPPTGAFAEFASPATFNHAIPGESFAVKVRLVNRSHANVTPIEITIHAPEGWQVSGDQRRGGALAYNQAASTNFKVTIPENATATRPYWHRDSIEEAEYKIDRSNEQNLPFPPTPAVALAKLEVMGTAITVHDAVHVTLREEPYGIVTPPLTVVPAISVSFPVEQGVLPVGRQQYKVSVIVRSSVMGPAHGTVKLQLPAGFISKPPAANFSFDKEDEEAAFDFVVTVPTTVQQSKPYALTAVATYNGHDYSEGYRTVTAHELQRFNLYRSATHELRSVDVKVAANLKIGYIMGSGDDVPAALEQLDIHPEILNSGDLANVSLDKYDAIVVGVRAYAVRPDIKTYNGRLLAYVKDGGVLLVQYQTPEFDNNFGPYPYQMTSNPEEVSEEDSELKILQPANPIFTTPNRISMSDFSGWVEERGSKFLKTWDAKYTPMVESHDQNQAPQEGGFLYAPYGKGVYIYSAYAWYRQLPYAVPGAFRIYANMLSLRRTLNQAGRQRAAGKGANATVAKLPN